MFVASAMRYDHRRENLDQSAVNFVSYADEGREEE
jgi:hypothetical protein